jgi:dienelactone hydrolase
MTVADSRFRRTAFTAVIALSATALFTSASPAASSSSGSGSQIPTISTSPRPRLPAPTGPYPVGTTSRYLNDVSRTDPWVPTAKTRELMITLWYPARNRDGKPAAYLTPTESELLLRGAGLTDVPADALSRTRTNAFLDTEPVGTPRSRPLVVLSPGFTWPRSSLSALAEELAASGYVVVGIDHTYETFATTFPDGRVTTCEACALQTDDFGRAAVESRARDVSFVLDQLLAHPHWAGAGLIDPRRIGMAGSSLGGASSGQTMLTDARVRAGVNLDGTMFAPLPESGLARPFLFLGEPSYHRPGSTDEVSWDRDWARLTGWKRWLVMAGSVHASFTDYDLLTEQIGVDLGSELTGARTVELTRRYVRAFFDRHLRGINQPLLQHPSSRYPEMLFCTPETGTCR